MQPTTYQQPEIRDANDQIIRSGTFGKNTALSNSTNDGWIDYVVNNLEYLHNTDASPTTAGLMSAADKDKLNKVAPVGSIIAFAGASATPSGYLLCDGSAVSRTTYANLFAIIGTTYGSGNGSTTFNLPNLTDKVLQGSATAGNTKAAGLPNITGRANITLGNIRVYTHNPSGVFSYGTAVTSVSNVSISGSKDGSNIGVDLSFSASSANPIYGNSITVQPPALTTRFCIKY